jgi:hypothetical protein
MPEAIHIFGKPEIEVNPGIVFTSLNRNDPFVLS